MGRRLKSLAAPTARAVQCNEVYLEPEAIDDLRKLGPAADKRYSLGHTIHHLGLSLMNDTLLDVFVGGFLGWIASLITLRYSERRGRLQAPLNYLKVMRDRTSGIYEKAIEVLEVNAAKDHLPVRLIAISLSSCQKKYEPPLLVNTPPRATN
jgi:hypothetical protein